MWDLYFLGRSSLEAQICPMNVPLTGKHLRDDVVDHIAIPFVDARTLQR
jgi:hypothetical protein